MPLSCSLCKYFLHKKFRIFTFTSTISGSWKRPATCTLFKSSNMYVAGMVANLCLTLNNSSVCVCPKPLENRLLAPLIQTMSPGENLNLTFCILSDFLGRYCSGHTCNSFSLLIVIGALLTPK